MKNAALIVKEDGLIYVNEVPEEPKWHEIPATPDSSDYEIRDEQREEHEKALASAKENAVLCADQEKAKEIIKAKFGHDIDQMNINTKGYQYPIPGLEWEVQWVNKKGGMSGRAEAYAVAILTLSEQPKGEEGQEELTALDLKMFIERELGGYRTVHMGRSYRVINRQFVYESDIMSLAEDLLRNFTITRNLKENQ